MKRSEAINKIHSLGLRLTAQRLEILDEVSTLDGHFSAEDIILALRTRGRKASRVTVYRMLPSLLKAGILREVIFSEGHAHYEHADSKPHHEHLICRKCGSVEEFECPPIENSLRQVCEECNFEAEAHKVEVTGLCCKCREDEKR